MMRKRLAILLVTVLLTLGLIVGTASPALAGTESRSLACNHQYVNFWSYGGAWYRSVLAGWNNVYVGGARYHYHHRDHYVWNGSYWAYQHRHTWIWCGNATH